VASDVVGDARGGAAVRGLVRASRGSRCRWNNVGALAAEAATKKVAKVFAVEHELLKDYTADGYTAAIEELVRKVSPKIVLFPHTYQVRDFAPKLATRFDQVLISDVIAVRFESPSPVFVRLLFQGKLNGDVRVGGTDPHFVSIQAARGEPTLSNRVRAWSRRSPRARCIEDPAEAGGSLPRIGARGGFDGRGNYRFRRTRDQGEGNIPVVEELAKALGAELAASRPICDAGWLPMERQVGSSDKRSRPRSTSPSAFPARSSTWWDEGRQDHRRNQ